MTAGTRGKWSESEVKKKHVLYSGYSSFTFLRLPDARAGSRQPTLSDFMSMHRSQHSLIEVKEVSNHDYRLPHQNFDENKVGRMRTWQMAGSMAHVLVCFNPGAKTATWRYAPLDYFLKRTGGSWDMRDIPVITLDKAMEIMYGPPPTVRI